MGKNRVIKMSKEYPLITKPVTATSGPNFNTIFPVGYVMLTKDSTNPSGTFGGTWESISTDQFLIGAGPSYTHGSSGGSLSHTIKENEVSSHTHNLIGLQSDASSIMHNHGGIPSGVSTSWHSGWPATRGHDPDGYQTTYNSTGSVGQADNTLNGGIGQKSNRTGGTIYGNGHSHGGTSTEAGVHNHTITVDNMPAITPRDADPYEYTPPFFGVFIWKRIA